MQPVNRRQLLACSPLALSALAVSNEDRKGSLDREYIARIATAALKAWEVPGLALGILRNGRVIYLEGHGVKQLGQTEQITPDSLFAIASCTKAFTSTALAMLVGKGLMHWDAPVRDYLEYFRLADPSADRLVTLRDLLCHRTGLGSHDLLWYRAAWSPRDAVRRIAHVPPDLQFRSSFQYQSTMVTAAGLALEAVLGKAENVKDASWSGFIRKEILEPLGMSRTYFTTQEARRQKDLATPHQRKPDGKVVPINWYETREPDPAGSVVSCARDLCQWAMFQLREGTVLREGREESLVNREALRQTHLPQNIIPLNGHDREMQPETHTMTYCLGWVRQDYRGQLLVSHAGTIDGFRTHITLVPDHQIGIVLLNNLHGTDMNLAISNTLVDHLLGLPEKDWNAILGKVARAKDAEAKQRLVNREKVRQKNTKPSLDLAAYTGTYLEPAFGVARVSLEDGRLIWQWSTFKCPLEHYHYDTFIAREELLHDPFVNYSLGLDGRVVTMNAIERYFVRVGDR